MMRKISLLGCLLLCASPSFAQKAAKKKMKLVWSDEFNYKGLPDSTKWNFEKGYVRNKEPQYYTSKRLENCRIENGKLVFEARRDAYVYDVANGKTAEYTSASINTQGKHSFQYGRIEIKAKVPAGAGLWPAFWMMGENSKEVGWPVCGEIDIMEFLGKSPSTVFATVHHADVTEKGYKTVGDSIVNVKPTEGFHTYALEWYPDRMEFYYDNQKYFSFDIKGSQVAAFNPFQKKHYILLNLALGHSTSWPGPTDNAVLPAKFLIDYVRVYQWK